MRHKTWGTGWPSRNILNDFHAELPRGWGWNTFENGWLWLVGNTFFTVNTMPCLKYVYYDFFMCVMSHLKQPPSFSLSQSVTPGIALSPLQLDVIIEWPLIVTLTLYCWTARNSEHSTKYSHMFNVSREIHTRQCCCTVCTTYSCNCHSALTHASSLGMQRRDRAPSAYMY